MTYDNFLKLTPNQRSSTVVVFYGNEPFFKDEGKKLIRRECQASIVAEMTIGRSSVRAHEFLNEAMTPSLWGGWKLVVANEADKVLADHFEELLLLQRSSRNKGVNVILIVDTFDRRTKAAKELEKAVLVVECKQLYDSAPPWLAASTPWDTPLARWALRQAKTLGLGASLQNAHVLTQITGNNLYEIRSTIEKLVTAGVQEVNDQALEQLTGQSRRDNVFALGQAVGDRDWPRAMEIIKRIFERGMATKDDVITDASTICLIMISRIFAKVKELAKLRQHLDKGGSRSRDDIIRVSGTAPFLADRVLAEADKWQGVNLGEVMSAMEKAQLAVKGLESLGKPRQILEHLVGTLGQETGPKAA